MQRRRPWMLHRTTLLVLGVALGLSTLVYLSADRAADRDQDRLLQDRADQILSILTGFESSLEADLATSTAIADLTNGDAKMWVDEIGSGNEEIPGSSYVLLRRTTDGLVPVASVGPPALGPGDDPATQALLDEAAAGPLVVVGIYGKPPLRTVGVAAGRPGHSGEFVTYQEISLVAAAGDDAADDPGLFADISMALYLGAEPSDEGRIVEFGEDDPLTVEHGVARADLGSSEIFLAVSTTKPLVGGVAPVLPYALLALSVAGAIAITAVVELNLRRRDDAVVSIRDLERKNDELDRSLQVQREGEAARALLEEELRQSQRLEAVGQLAGGVAHDFNNLLAAISSYSELALEDLADHPSRDDIEEIRAAARRGATLVRQLLLFSRATPASAGVVDLNAVIGAFEQLLRHALGEGITLEVDLEPDLGCVHGVIGELEQVIMNLAVNARDALDGQGVVSIATGSFVVGSDGAANGLAPGRYVRCTVSDDGPGMPPEVVTRAFEPFFTTKDRGRGTGLGLATVYGIVQRAGGRIRIDSAPGEGTTVEIVFAEVSGQAEPVDDSGGHDTVTPPVRPATRLLLAEDEPSVRASTRRLLERRGYIVVEAESGVEALERYDRGRIDALVTDMMMPGGMNGRELAAALRERQPDLAVVFMTGHRDDVISDLEIPGDEAVVLTKPVAASELVAAIESALARRVRA